MDDTQSYRGLRFGHDSQPVSRRLIAVGVVLIGFTLLWWLIPRLTSYWLMLPVLAALVWVASYGWRQALAAVHELIHRFEQV